MKGKIVYGKATRFANEHLKVEIGENEVGYVHASELAPYPGYTLNDEGYSKAATYCIGVKLPYLVTSISVKGPILSRRLLAEDTLETLKAEKLHDYVVGTITGYATNEKGIYGVYVDVNGVYGLCPSAELSYCYLADPSVAFSIGDKLEFAITSITEDNKLFLSRIATLPSKEAMLEKYTKNEIVLGNLVCRVNHKRDNADSRSWFVIIDQNVAGMVDIPVNQKVRPGIPVSLTIR